MRYTVPDYYNRFDCLAGNCPATCCAGWQIVIDDRSLRKYANAVGSFGNRLRNSVDFQEKVFYQYEKRCAFLNEENLCDMHIEAGVKMMCETCRKYPKHIEEFDNEREITLSISCPAAAKLILDEQKKAGWISHEDEKEEAFDEEFDDFLYSALQDTRDLMIQILQDRTIPVHLRMAEVLALGHDVQNRINARRIFDIQDVLQRYGGESARKRLQKKLSEEKGENYRLLGILKELEVLDPKWRINTEAWIETSNPEERVTAARETELEQMVIYYLFTYFCGAVYDGDAFAKVKMALVSTLIWEEVCYFAEKEKQDKLSFDERMMLAVGYSRELEHSDPNLNKMEELMNTRKETEFHQLLALLTGFCQK